MRVRAVDGALAGSLVLLSAAVAWRFLRPSPAPRADSSGAAPVGIGHRLSPEFVESAPRSPARQGTVALRFPDGASLLGVAAARVFPIDGGRIALETVAGLVGTQSPEGLDVSSWLARARPSGPHALQLGCWVETDGRTELRSVWVRLDPSSLLASGVEADVPAGRRVSVTVANAAGQPVPGALVSVDPQGYEPGLVGTMAFTDDHGTVRLSGLPEGPRHRFTVSLPDGIGPDRQAVRLDVEPGAQEVTLRTQTAGRWAFVRSHLVTPLRGVSLQVESVAGEDGALAGAWPVASWIGPGRGPRIPFWWMVPEEGGRDGPCVLRLRGFEPCRIQSPRLPAVLELDLAERRVTARPE